MQTNALAQEIARVLDDKKALNILALKVDHLTVLCDYMVIASGRSATQVSALTDYLEEELEKLGVTPTRVEGRGDSRWVVMDLGHIIVHLFHQEERAYYNLERLWDDGTNRMPLPFETETAPCPIV